MADGVNGSGFGERLRMARHMKGLAQTDLGRLAEIHPNQISRYEQGLSYPTSSTLRKIAEVLEISGDYLLNGDTSNAARAHFEDQELLQLFQKAAALSPESKKALKLVVHGMFSLEKMEEITLSSRE